MSLMNSPRIESEFIEAQKSWELEKLYVDLASAKGKALTPVEKKFLRGLLCGFSPAEIANVVYQTRSSSTVRVYLSNGLYKYLEEMLSNQVGYLVKVKNWSHVTHLLEKAGYKKNWLNVKSTSFLPPRPSTEPEADFSQIKSPKIQDWGEAVDVKGFSGRNRELATVEDWIVNHRCRLVVLLGMGGIGKTALAIKLAEDIQDQFEYVIWRSLRFAPPLDILLHQIKQIFAPKSTIEQTEGLGITNKISRLINDLRNARCLLVLDHFDAILDRRVDEASILTQHPANYSRSQIVYRQGYEDYGEMIRRVGDSSHQSCLLLTSREKPPEIAANEGGKLPVRVCKLTGLNQDAAMALLHAKGFNQLPLESGQILLQRYAGNPLFLKLAATTINDLFGGSVDNFVNQDTVVLGEMRIVLDEQLQKLSTLEKHILCWLTLNFHISIEHLPVMMMPELSPSMARRLILETLELLQRRSLIELQDSHVCINTVVRQYILESLMTEQSQSGIDKGFLRQNSTLAAVWEKYIGEHPDLK
ncbi:NB-ARC domain-containing protein [Richelia sinica]|nr:NB-ARC domain-containing protein [Richelia sinica]MBD2664807.1 ATP-binding protein [Richelia sinica FACHB-800]